MENMDIEHYYKILQGYEHERDIIIRENELERAYGLFMLGGRWIFSGGAVDGKNIQTIVEDYHSTMGWNKEYRLGTDDYEQLTQLGVDRKMRLVLEKAKEKVMYLINSNKQELIGKNVEILELKIPHKEISQDTKSLVDKFRIK